MQPAETALLKLALTPGIGARTVAKLLEVFGSAEAVLAAPAPAWGKIRGVSPRHAAAARSDSVSSRVESVRERCRPLGVEIVTLASPAYPPPLAAIHDPPPVLYVRGTLPSFAAIEGAAALVGTRKPSSHGLAFAYRVGADLAHAGVPVVSGLALGIDTEVHRGVVSAGGVGIAVLPGGLDSVHPFENTRLAAQLCERGCLISENPPGTSLRRGHFVGRNRLISGLARAVLVIEAGERSGALITADFAAEQGRAVLVMPGRPGDPRVAGSLQLLHDGATLALSAADVAAELGLQLPAERRFDLPGLGTGAALLARGASFDAILAVSGLSPPVLLAHLSRLELAGRVRRAADGTYQLLDA